MAVAMDIGWRSPSFHLGSSGKKRGWGDDQQKLLQLMIGQPPIDEGTSATTLDLLGGSSTSSTSIVEKEQPLDLELDMEMPPPSGWEKRLDLKLGKFYYVNLSSGKSTYEHPSKQPCTQSSLSQQFLNLGGQSTALRDKDSAARSWDLQSELDRIDMKDESQLDLKLNLGGCVPMPKSLSTIEAVQEALKRSQAAAATTTTSTSSKQQQMPFLSPATSTSSSSSSKMNSRSTDASESIEKLACSSAFVAEVVDSKIRQAPTAAAADAKVVLTGCKRCLMYVMLTRADPRCPKCGSSVVLDIPLQQQLPKRPRLELDL